MNRRSILHKSPLAGTLSLALPIALWAVVVAQSYLWNVTGVETNTQNLAMERGRMVFSVIEATRSWAARHGGIYAPATDMSPPNPYLKAFEKDISTPSGRFLTLINPAYMTRQLAEVMSKTDITIHLTSLIPLNPNNEPNEWEQRALMSFERGTREVIEIVSGDNGPQYNFMAPLHVKKSCLQCHAVQGYKEGNIRGGIRVSFPITEVIEAEHKLITKLQYIHVAMFLLLSALSSVAIVWVRNLINNLEHERNQRDDIIAEQTLELTNEVKERRKSQEELKTLSTIDDLTGTRNRRSLNDTLKMESDRAERYGDLFSVVMMDLDKFKSVNDTHGHAVGDKVLQSFSKHVQGHLRETDMLARYGGEEFVILMPHTNETAALKTAERIRLGVMDMKIPLPEDHLSITVSMGIAQYTPEHSQNMDDLLNRADQALYKAKNSGRNRCVVAT